MPVQDDDMNSDAFSLIRDKDEKLLATPTFHGAVLHVAEDLLPSTSPSTSPTEAAATTLKKRKRVYLYILRLRHELHVGTRLERASAFKTTHESKILASEFNLLTRRRLYIITKSDESRRALELVWTLPLPALMDGTLPGLFTHSPVPSEDEVHGGEKNASYASTIGSYLFNAATQRASSRTSSQYHRIARLLKHLPRDDDPKKIDLRARMEALQRTLQYFDPPHPPSSSKLGSAWLLSPILSAFRLQQGERDEQGAELPRFQLACNDADDVFEDHQNLMTLLFTSKLKTAAAYVAARYAGVWPRRFTLLFTLGKTARSPDAPLFSTSTWGSVAIHSVRTTSVEYAVDAPRLAGILVLQQSLQDRRRPNVHLDILMARLEGGSGVEKAMVRSRAIDAIASWIRTVASPYDGVRIHPEAHGIFRSKNDWKLLQSLIEVRVQAVTTIGEESIAERLDLSRLPSTLLLGMTHASLPKASATGVSPFSWQFSVGPARPPHVSLVQLPPKAQTIKRERQVDYYEDNVEEEEETEERLAKVARLEQPVLLEDLSDVFSDLTDQFHGTLWADPFSEL
jgi:hypothetical protein